MSGSTGLADWQESVRAIGEALLTVEVNTVEKASMSAQKMPEVPVALHAIIDTYREYLVDLGFPIDGTLLAQAKQRMDLSPTARDTPQRDKALVDQLSAWHPTQHAEPPDLTNGPETFEALQWAAWAALRDLKTIREHSLTPGGDPVFDAETGGVLSRIRANSRQLREAAVVLRDKHVPASGKLPLFGGTIEATIRALVNDPLPPLSVPLDILVLVRKAWDVGTETVMMQTVMQVDGDVVLRISPALADARRAFFSDLHTGCVKVGIGQWNSLFALVRDLVGEIGRTIFGIAGG